MAKKEEKEIERWVTVNGARVPIFKDGSIGGPKALRDKVQKKIDNDPANKGVTRKDVEELTAKKDKLKGTKLKTKPISNEEVKAMKENNVFAKKVPEHITDAKSVNELHDKLKSQGLSMESADADDIKRDYRSMNGEKVSLYDEDGNEYRGTFNRYSDGSTEIVNIKKEWYNRTPEDAHSANIKNKKAKQINEDFDTKEKQIADNKKEADERSGKQYEWYKQAKKEGRIDKDAEFETFIDYSPIDDSRVKRQLERARKMELADEADAYDRAHNEGKYAKTNNNKSYKPGMTKEERKQWLEDAPVGTKIEGFTDKNGNPLRIEKQEGYHKVYGGAGAGSSIKETYWTINGEKNNYMARTLREAEEGTSQYYKFGKKSKTSSKKGTARKEQLEIQIDDMYSKYANKFSVDPNQWLMYGEEGKKAYYAYKNAVAEFEPDAKKRKKYFKDRRTF